MEVLIRDLCNELVRLSDITVEAVITEPVSTRVSRGAIPLSLPNGGAGRAAPSASPVPIGVSRGFSNLPPTKPTLSLENLTAARTGRSHASYVESVLSANPFRDANFVLRNINNFRYFLAATHADLIADTLTIPKTYTVPENTMVFKTGGGDACGTIVMATYFHNVLHNYFKKESLAYTFDRILGGDTNLSLNRPLQSLIFVTPGEETFDKILTMGQSDFTNEHLKNVIGITLMSHDGDKLVLTDTPETREITGEIITNSQRGKAPYTEISVIQKINKSFPISPTDSIKANVIVFMSCSSGPAAPHDYFIATKHAGKATRHSTAGSTSVIERPRGLPRFPDECKDIVNTNITRSALDIERVSYYLNQSAGYGSASENLGTLEEEASVHKTKLISNITAAIAMAESVTPNQEELNRLLGVIDANREEYVSTMRQLYEMAVNKRSSLLAFRGLVEAEGINITRYKSMLDKVEQDVETARDAAISRTGKCAQLGRWFCAIPSRIGKYVKGSSQGGGARRRTRHRRYKRSRTHRRR